MTALSDLREQIRNLHFADEGEVLKSLRADHEPAPAIKQAASLRAIELVETLRRSTRPGVMESFLSEYGLSTDEGIALMCLAEALLRVPDSETIDELIDDKVAPSAWNEHLGHSSSSLVNASTWALMLTGKVLSDDGQGMGRMLRGAVRRLGEPVIRAAVQQAMKELGRQFVLGESIEGAITRGRKQLARGYTYSYDMLGEAAMTARDADRNYQAYLRSISALVAVTTGKDVRSNPGISIKLSAIHPRYIATQYERVMSELAPRVLNLCLKAAEAGIGLNIDAEEADRLDLSLDVIEAVLSDERLAGWDGFGVVVQAFGKRASGVLDWLYFLAEKLDRKIMVRLVKGAYWDTEIKQAQLRGLTDFPVFTRKQATDASYLCCARKLLGMTDRVFPQFATHNAHTVAAILELADDHTVFEFQRLHGMGEGLHDLVLAGNGTRCRIYAPVGTHRDLLAYLVRRLLENGANSSFVNQVLNEAVPPETICADPFEALDSFATVTNPGLVRPASLFGGARQNSEGWDLTIAQDLWRYNSARESFAEHRWDLRPLMVATPVGTQVQVIENPARPTEKVGTVLLAGVEDVDQAISDSGPWSADAGERARVLRRASDLFEKNAGEIFALLAREAGKTPSDAISELREAVDFLRYYADEAERLVSADARGRFACISPWNFPLAIFTGQIAAALAAGNAVLAKPADPTPLIAVRAVSWLHESGVPLSALQVLPGSGVEVGARLVADSRIDGVCFTGSTLTAQRINRAMAENVSPDAPLIAETGGINAMIVDSTALPEQAVRDLVVSAFQSAGQRCSAARVLYLQEDIAENFLEMLFGAMEELSLGDPWLATTDVGPIITGKARQDIQTYVDHARADGRLLKQLRAPSGGKFVGPAVIRVKSIADVTREVFGPVLHVATFKADELDDIVTAINATGFGLTFGMHSRIDDRIASVTDKLKVGNIYINRNQIGAVVGSQPFGGEGLSGTGPKAGGAHYVPRFSKSARCEGGQTSGVKVGLAALQKAVTAASRTRTPLLGTDALPGPTGESNQFSVYGRGVVLCLGPTAEDARRQATMAELNGCVAVRVAPGLDHSEGLDGQLDPLALEELEGFDLVVSWANDKVLRKFRTALANRDGALISLVAAENFGPWCVVERHICIDTTAAGGNATLLASVS